MVSYCRCGHERFFHKREGVSGARAMYCFLKTCECERYIKKTLEV